LPESLQRHRAEIAEEVSRCIGLVVAGGHVGVLLHLLHVFGLADMVRATADRPLITWSAGAMALSERVVLFHDHLVPPGSKDLAYRPAELYAEGLGIYSGLLPFPHARRRLQQDDVDHVRQIAERFAPRTCLLLPDGVRVDVREHEPLPAGTRWLSPADGVVIQPESV
jgi:peptidase E